LSVENNLRSNWGRDQTPPASGVIEIVSSAPNVGTCPSNEAGCNGGCYPAAEFTTGRELNGYILHNQAPGIPEVPLADAGDADPGTVNSLTLQCARLIGSRSVGSCNCGSK